MTTRIKTLAAATLALAASSFSAQAVTITAADGLNLSRNVTQNDDLQVFSEATGVGVDTGAVTLDYLVGNNINVGDTVGGVNTFSSGVDLLAGEYDSFLVHFDSAAGGRVSDIVVDFGAVIVGLIVSSAGGENLLLASDSIFGTAANYETSSARRSENTDQITLLDDTTLSFNLAINSVHIDNIRVLTEVAAVPVPASLPLLLAGFGGLAIARRRS